MCAKFGYLDPEDIRETLAAQYTNAAQKPVFREGVLKITLIQLFPRSSMIVFYD